MKLPHIEAAQNPVGWAQKKSLVATVTDAVSGVDRVFWPTDQNATTGTAMEASGNIYRSGSLTTNGTYYVIAMTSWSNRNVETVTVDKIDTIPPVISDAKQNLKEKHHSLKLFRQKYQIIVIALKRFFTVRQRQGQLAALLCYYPIKDMFHQRSNIMERIISTRLMKRETVLRTECPS